MFRRFEANELGRDFVVGDVHGCFDLLRLAMLRAGFDKSTDRLFSVGDLVDRGPQSGEAVEWLTQSWFHAVRGNHEQMVVDVMAGRASEHLHDANGGAWFARLSHAERIATAEAFARLPLAIEVDTEAGPVGIVHAEVPGDDWVAFRAMLAAIDAGESGKREHIERFALWGRDVIRGRSPFSGVVGIGCVYVGHTPVAGATRVANVCYLDTGAVFGRAMSIAALPGAVVMRVAA